MDKRAPSRLCPWDPAPESVAFPNSRFVQIQFAFDAAQNVVVDLAFVPQAYGCGTLDLQGLKRKFHEAPMLGCGRRFATVRFDAREAVRIVLDQIVVELARILAVLFPSLF